MTLEEYINGLPEKGLKLARALGDEIRSNAEAIYPGLPYDVSAVGETYPSPSVSVTRLDMPYGCIVQAEGEGVIFMEFGAGVHFNDGSYPEPKPAGIVGIGQYGSGKGMDEAWQFRYGDGYYTTYGTPKTMPFYYSKKFALDNIETIARKVF